MVERIYMFGDSSYIVGKYNKGGGAAKVIYNCSTVTLILIKALKLL